MKSHDVILAPEAIADIGSIRDWIEQSGGDGAADDFLSRLEAFLAKYSVAPLRGTPRTLVRPGLRVVGFERRLTIAFCVVGERVEILRVFSAGRDWESEFSDF